MIPNGAGFEMNNSGAGQGGLLFMRIKHLILNNPLSMNVSGRGFQGSPAVQGSGIHGIGLGDDTSSNGNGGAGSASGNGGGGGGNVGAGGQNDTTLSAAGQSVFNCSGPCFPIKGHKIILGGAGGGDNTIVGGSGGGAIVLHIEQITGGAHTLTLDAQGQPGASGGGGGGAGGVIHLTSSSVNKPVAAYANGGNGDSKGGGGGGGAIEIPMCADNSTEPLANIIAASDVTGGPAGGVGSAAVGDSGDKSEIRNEPALCQ